MFSDFLSLQEFITLEEVSGIGESVPSHEEMCITTGMIISTLNQRRTRMVKNTYNWSPDVLGDYGPGTAWVGWSSYHYKIEIFKNLITDDL